MANFARRIVSGNKARFKDEELDVELDLVYVTDNVIIMGYPGAKNVKHCEEQNPYSNVILRHSGGYGSLLSQLKA